MGEAEGRWRRRRSRRWGKTTEEEEEEAREAEEAGEGDGGGGQEVAQKSALPGHRGDSSKSQQKPQMTWILTLPC